MKVENYIDIIIGGLQLIAIIIAIITVHFNTKDSKKSRISSTVINRRVSRCENIRLYSVNLISLISPVVIVEYKKSLNTNYPRELIEVSSQISMIFDYTYKQDRDIIEIKDSLVKLALDYFSNSLSDIDKSKPNNDNLKEIENKIYVLKQNINSYLLAEWERIKTETETGNKISLDEWVESYNNFTTQYDQYYNNEYSNND